MEEQPDLSHLSAEERAIIESVMMKLKVEEATETKIAQKADAELEEIDKQINGRKESARRLVGTQDDAICQICQKTKFADGIGHKCFYCQLRSCARCGGRAQSKNKAIWACSLCQKRQQILMKTGKWFQQPDEVVAKTSNAGMSSPSQSQSPVPSTSGADHLSSVPQIITPPSQPIANGGPPNQMPQSSQSRQSTSAPQQQQQQHRQQGRPGNGDVISSNGPPVSSVSGRGGDPRRQNSLNRQPTAEASDSPRQPNGSLPHQNQTRPTEMRQGESRNRSQSTVVNAVPQTRPEDRKHSTNTTRRTSDRTGGPFGHQSGDEQRNFDGSNHRLTVSQAPQRRASDVYVDRTPDSSRRNQSSRNEVTSPVRNGPFDRTTTEYREPARSSQSSTSRTEFRRTRSIREEDGRRGSIGVRLGPAPTYSTSVNTSTAAVPPIDVPSVPPAVVQPTSTYRQKKSRLHRRLNAIDEALEAQVRSMSSSDDEMPSTSDGIGFGGEDVRQRVPDECTSEKDLLRYIYGSDKAKNGRKSGAVSDYSSDVSPRSTRPSPAVVPGNVLAAKIRTYLSHPVTWQPSADQRRLIGHMVLHRTDGASNGDLGLKVVGGRRSDTGRLGAFVTRVKQGSVADTVGRLRPGDEVLEWNGQALQNATFDQVYEIISASKNETQVELIVSRSACVPGGDDFLHVQPVPTRQLPNPQYGMGYDSGEYPYSGGASPLIPPHALTHSQSAMLHPQHVSPLHRHTVPPGFYADTLSNETAQCYGRGQLFGRIELSLFYSHHERQLVVTVERAFDLPPRPDGTPRNPYVKLFLLPDRSEKSRRQSAVLAETTTPLWQEAFYYQHLTEPILMDRALEVTVWDYDKYETNSFLGETLVDFSTIPLDGQPLLYTLVDMDEENPLRTRLRQRKLSQYSGGQPPRPRSEMAYGYQNKQMRHEQRDADPYGEVYEHEREPAMHRSRTYDRTATQGRMTPVRMDEDWSMNQSAGYLSDHGYSRAHSRYQRQRRPRSATAMRPMTASEMGASRLYSRGAPQEHQQQSWQDDARYLGGGGMGGGGGPSQSSSQRYGGGDPRSPNGRLVMEAMQEQPQGYGSDGSESIHSAHSMPVVRTINRRMPLPNGGGLHDSLEQSVDDYLVEDMQSVGRGEKTGGAGAAGTSSSQQMKERKKSLMTRFIPGRQTGADAKRTGFARSEEVGIPGNLSADRLQTPFLKQASKESNDSSDNWLPVLPEGPLGSFVDNLGPGQVVGRQVLASPVLGQLQVALMGGRGGIEVEVVKADRLVVKPGTKISPAPYVKVYLMEGKQCIAKAKTNPVKRTTAPLIQQRLQFNENPKGKMLQLTVLGDYGRMERKAFMGIAQIRLDDLSLGAQPVTGWYQLFHSSSLAGTGPVRKDSENSLTGQPQQ